VQAFARVVGVGPAAEVGEGGDGGADEDVSAGGEGEGRWRGLGHAGEGVSGPACGWIVDTAAAPLEHKGQCGEYEREDRKEEEEASPSRAAAGGGGGGRRRHLRRPIY
jgi:hypothetical protein